ncbi:unnamed protein product, partial [Phaeothamnion confervicola]
KLRHLRQELLSDLLPHGVPGLDFLASLGAALLALWIRMYLHYIGQWAYL